MRDFSSYDVKKVVKFEDNTVNQDENDVPLSSKAKRINIKNKKEEEFDKKRDKILQSLDLNSNEPLGKTAKQIA